MLFAARYTLKVTTNRHTAAKLMFDASYCLVLVEAVASMWQLVAVPLLFMQRKNC